MNVVVLLYFGCIIWALLHAAKEQQYFTEWIDRTALVGSSTGSTDALLSASNRTETLDPNSIYQREWSTKHYVVRRATGDDIPKLQQDGDEFSHCFYREYPRPDVHSGLPFIGEVFASPDKTAVFLAAEGRKFCQEKYDKSHDFFMNEATNKTIRFRCIFESDGSRVLSDPVHRRLSRRYGAGFVLIRCPVPKHLQDSIPRSGARTTAQHLTLESIVDLVTGRTFQQSGQPSPRISHLPICSHAWPSETEAYRQTPPKKYEIALMTRIAVSYTRGRDHQPLSIHQQDFVTWMEYHLALGFEHFYIYDDSSTPNSTIRKWCEPYIAQGVVTHTQYPYDDIVCDDGPYPKLMAGKQMYIGQVISGNSALRRYENEVEWMGHWDVDEYLTLKGVSNLTTLQQFIGDAGVGYDEIGLKRPVYGPCKNATAPKDPPLVPFESKQCYRYDGVPKGIYRTSTVLHFRVHKSHVRMDNNFTKRFEVPFIKGHIAHFRSGNAAGKVFKSVSPMHFAPFIKPLRKRLKCLGFGTTETHVKEADCGDLAKPAQFVTAERYERNPMFGLTDWHPPAGYGKKKKVQSGTAPDTTANLLVSKAKVSGVSTQKLALYEAQRNGGSR